MRVRTSLVVAGLGVAIVGGQVCCAILPAYAPNTGIESARARSTAASWNAWWEAENRSAPGFEAVPRLKPAATSTLVLDLARTGYAAPNVGTSPVSPMVEQKLAPGISLRALILLDPAFFEVDGRSVRKLEIVGAPAPAVDDAPPGEAPLSLRAQATAASLGRVLFPLHASARTGRTTVAVSIWADDAPIDEVHAEVCVGDATVCPDAPRLAETSPLGLAGYDPATPGLTRPDAAIHLVELERGKPLVGVLRLREWEDGKLVTWRLAQTVTALTEHVRATIAPALNSSAALPDELEARALDLQYLLFPAGDQAKEARTEFRRFIAKRLPGTMPAGQRCPDEGSGAEIPSISFRAVPYGGSAPLLLPVGFVGAEVGGKVHFLGFHFRIDQPMERQLYRAPSSCIDRWTLAFPPTDDGPLSTTWSVIRDDEPWSTLRDRGFKTGTEFRDWIRDESAPPESAFLVIVSHHGNDQLSFRGQEWILSDSFRRAFREPSVAVLDGCGTGLVTASDLIRALNAQGINAAIATQTEVPARMAGAFLRCITEKACPAPSEPEPLAKLYVRSVRCLSREAENPGDRPYGARALTFSLLGNGTILICRPKEIP